MKKVFALLAALVMSLGVCSAMAEYTVNPDLADTTTTLTLYGPSSWTTYEDTEDFLTGITTPGYHVIVERWAELYPNVTLDIQAVGWDSWQTAITTACLSGDVDIILHGASMVDLTLDLTPYLEKDAQYAASINQTAARLETNNLGQYKQSGISFNVSPMLMVLDKEIFEHYGVELPTENWTVYDMVEIAAKLTGTDPVTGEQTYGIQLQDMGANNLWFNFVKFADALGATVYNYGTNPLDSEVNYLSDESIAAFQMLADISQYCSPEAIEGVAVNQTLDGTNNWAMILREGIGTYKETIEYGTADQYVFMTMPLCVAGRYEGQPIPYAGDGNLAIWKDTPDADIAWEFIKFMTSDTAMLQYLVDTGVLPNNNEAIPMLVKVYDEEVVNAFMAAASAVPENYNNATNYNMNNASFGATTTNLITAVDNVLKGVMTAQEAAQFMQDGVDEYLAGLQ